MAVIEFTVEGQARFPFDMLRYDACWPKSPDDVAVLERMGGARYGTTHRLTLATNAHVTEPRCESFGWKVVKA